MTNTKQSDCAIYTKSRFIEFVNTFSSDIHGTNAILNYAKFVGLDRSTIHRNYHSDKAPPGFHKTIQRLVEEREAAKQEVRRLNKIIKEQGR